MAEQPDPATGLTPSEKDIIKNTWELVKKDIPGNGYDLFVKFFTENPSYQQLFKSFKDVPLSELKGNKRLLAHANNVLYQITMLVDYLDDTETLVEMLLKLGRNHYRRNITLEMFQNLQISFVGLLKEKLGPELMNDKAVNAWVKTYNVIVQVVDKGLKQAQSEQDS